LISKGELKPRYLKLRKIQDTYGLPIKNLSVADPDPVLFDSRIWDPGWVKIKISIRDEHPGSYFRELGNIFGLKILKFIDADPDPGVTESSRPWIRDGKIWIRDNTSRIRTTDKPVHLLVVVFRPG
jgi:hypothetical protein